LCRRGGLNPHGLNPKGVVYTKRRVVELLLDLMGYTADRNLVDAVAVEPAAGDGAFLAPMIERLAASCRALKRPLSDWVYRIIQGSEVLTLSRDYFRLRKPVDRRVYELARKHCGEQGEWKISLELLHKKTGASSHSREFKSMIRELVQNDHLPDYQVSLEEEMVTFRNRMTSQAPKEQPSYLVLDPETYHDARLVAPRYDVYYLEQEWRDMWVASGMPKLDFPGRAFVGFSKKRYQMKPRP
jgi:hypothetical protein